MPTISQGSEVTLSLGATDAYQVTVQSGGEAYVDLLSGAPGSPYSSPRLNGKTVLSMVFGPYGAAAQIKVRATSGSVTYANYVPEAPVTASSDGGLLGGTRKLGYTARTPYTNQYQNPLAFIDTSSISAWNDLAGAGVTATLDTSVLFNGQPTIRLDVPANFAGGTCRIGTTGATVRIPYNWDRSNIAYAIRCSNISALGNTVGMLGDSTLANRWECNAQSAANLPQMQYANNDWMVFKPGVSDQSAVGSPAVASLMRARLSFAVSNVGTATQIWVGFFGLMPKRPKPTLVMSFDDGFSAFDSFIKPLFKHYRIPCSFAVVSSLIGSSANYMTEAQMLALHNDSSGLFEMINHNRVHQNANSYADAASYVADVEVCRRYLQDRGITKGCWHHVYPNSIWRDDVSALLSAAGYLTGRASTAGANGEYQDQMIKAGDKLRWKLNIIANLQTGTTPANVQTAINALKTSGGVGFINAHDFQSADGSFIYSYENMTQVAGIIAAERDAGNIELMRYSDWYDTYVA